MKLLWVFGGAAAASVWCTLTACGGGGGSGTGNTSTGGSTGGSTTQTHTTTSTSSSTGTGGSTGSTSTTTSTTSTTVVDPICTNPNAQLSNACLSCLNGLPQSDPCFQPVSTACQGNGSCVAFANCSATCNDHAVDAGAAGAGGGGTACVAGESSGSGTPLQNCNACCENGNPSGFGVYFQDLIDNCVCTPGATCASACAQ